MCNGLTDDDDPAVDSSTQSTWYEDADGDGYGDASSSALLCSATSGWTADDTDCDDDDASTNPAATEVVDGVDKARPEARGPR